MMLKNLTKTCLLSFLFLGLIGCEYIIGGGEEKKPNGGDSVVVKTSIAGGWLSIDQARYKEFTTFDSLSGKIVATCLQRIGDFWVETLLVGIWREEDQVLYIKNEDDDEFPVIVPYRISGDTLIIDFPGGSTRHIRGDVAVLRETLDDIRTVDYTLVGTEWSLLPEREETLGFAYNYPFHIVYGGYRYLDGLYDNRSWYADTLDFRLVLLGLDLACGYSYCGYDTPFQFELNYEVIFVDDEKRLILRTVGLDGGALGPAEEWALDYDHFGGQAKIKAVFNADKITRFGDFLEIKIK